MKKNTKEKFNLNLQRFFETMALLFLVNLTFLVVNVLGGVLFTLGPTLKASHLVVMKHLQHDKVSFFKDYFKEFYKSYFPAMFSSLPHIILIGLAGTGFYLALYWNSTNFLKYITLAVSGTFIIYMLVSLMFVFFFKNRINHSYTEALRLSFTHPWGKFGYLLIILLITLSLFILCYIFVRIFIVFLFGIYFITIEYFGSKAFNDFYFMALEKKLDDKQRMYDEVAREIMIEDMQKAEKYHKLHQQKQLQKKVKNDENRNTKK